MATTTSQQQHRYNQEYEISQPGLTYKNNQRSSVAAATATSAPLRGERRDCMMSQTNKHSSRQTMTTAGSSSRGLSSDNSGLDRHVRLLDGSSGNNYGGPRNQQEERERQRRAEENAAFVKMLEEESFMLQGAPGGSSHPHGGSTQRSRTNSGEDPHGFPHPSSGYRDGSGSSGRPYSSRSNPNSANYSSSRSGGSRPAQRYSQRSQQQQMKQQQQPHYPHHLYSPYHHQHEEEEEDELLGSRRGSQHNNSRDIPLELSFPSNSSGGSSRDRNGFQPPPNPLMMMDQQQQHSNQRSSHRHPQEYNLNMAPDEMRRSVGSGGEDRGHPDQLHMFQRQSKSRSLSPGQSPLSNSRRHTVDTSRVEEFQPPPNLMSLEEAIYSLEMEGKEQLPSQPPTPPHIPSSQHPHQHRGSSRRDLPDEYDAAILTGTPSSDHRRHDQQARHHPSPHRHRQPQQPPPQRDDGHRHYHHPPPPQEIVTQNHHYHHRHSHDQPPGPPRHVYDQPPARLVAPVEVIEFPSDWDGREIEPTLDDELLDRDEDEYYRRRRQHAQHKQQPMQSIQSQSLQPMPSSYRTNNSSSNAHPSNSSRLSSVRRSQSTVSNDSLGGYSQNVALSGRRAPMQMIEVSPGVSMPFRGSEETWEAIALNRIVRTQCMGCSIHLYCVEDAELVVCPDCQTMSPAHQDDDNNNNPHPKRSGLGLGFKEDQLVQWRNAGP